MDRPYRQPDARVNEALRCLYCGRERDARGKCRGCGAEAPSVPCSACEEPVAAPLDRCSCGAPCTAWSQAAPHELSCPRCSGRLERVQLDIAAVHVEQCARCLGCFARTEDFSELVGLEEAGQAVGLRRFTPLPPKHVLPRQTLLAPVSCPHCSREMDRARFAQRASLIVDVCPPHGIWLDAGELPSVLNFVKQRSEGHVEPGEAEREDQKKWERIERLRAQEELVVELHTRKRR